MQLAPEYLIVLVIAAAIIVFFVIGLLISRVPKQSWKLQLSAKFSLAMKKQPQSAAEGIACLIEADALFDQLLKQISKGQTMGERLKASRNRFSSNDYQQIWAAHKLRNTVVHEPDHGVSLAELKHARSTLAGIAIRYLSM